MNNISYSAIKTIILYEIKRFFKDLQFNLIAPLINTILFIFIISTVYTYYSFNVGSDSYITFIIPGMLMILIFQTSFSHLSETILSMKLIGSFDDFLISPISRVEIFISFIISSIIICVFVCFINLIVISLFTEFLIINYFSLLYYLIISILIFSSIGALTGYLAFTWDFKSSISDFFILPISFLSGTFFPIDSLDKNWQFIFSYNPFYYLVSGFRGSFIKEFEITFYGDAYITITFFFIFIISAYIFKIGYKVIN